MNVYDPSVSQELVDKPVTTYLLFSDIGIKIFVEKFVIFLSLLFYMIARENNTNEQNIKSWKFNNL